MKTATMSIRSSLPVIILAALLLMPLGLEQYRLYVASLVLDLFDPGDRVESDARLCGADPLAHAAFMAIGAYSVAILRPLGVPFEVAVLVGAAISFLLGIAVGFPALRVKHHYLAMVTLGFTIIVFLCIRNFEALTGGNFGITSILRPDWGSVSFRSDRAFYVYTLLWAIPVIASAHWLLHSRWGRAFEGDPRE